MAGREISFSGIMLKQPLGEFFVGKMTYQDLRDISYADIRNIESGLDEYIGIQRKLNLQRVKEIGQFVNSIDATFPTSIVLAVPERCFEYDEKDNLIKLKESPASDEDFGENDPGIEFDNIASILDGQHRIEGLQHFSGEEFDLPVTIIVNADMADQAWIFATVNLAQTKVNRSLVYDLMDYSKSRSPQKTCHNIVVALDTKEKSPFYNLIKRLGSATPGRTNETLTQATFVTALISFITVDPIVDRETLRRQKKIKLADNSELTKTPFRNLFIEEEDSEIAKIVFEYFSAVKERWPNAWASREAGKILPRTNGFRAMMRLLKNIYLNAKQGEQIGQPMVKQEFLDYLYRSSIKDDEFDSENFPPGSSGEKQLYDLLREQIEV